MSKFTLIIDSSQVSTFIECPQLWKYKYVDRLVQKIRDPESDEPLNAGTYGHALLDRYYIARANNLSLNQAVAYSLAFDPDCDICECGDRVTDHQLIESLRLNECSKCKTCANFRPKRFELKDETRQIVQNRVREYLFNHQSGDIEPLSPQHVEVGFSEPIYEDSDNLFVLEGRIDLIGKLQGLNCIMDHKFQFKRHFLYPKSIQFKNYCMVTKCLMFMVNYIRLHKNPDKFTLQRTITSFTAPELLNWKNELIKVFFLMKQSIQSDSFEKRWTSCKGYGETYDMEKAKFCKFTQLCEEYNMNMRAIKKDQLYSISERVWRPW